VTDKPKRTKGKSKAKPPKEAAPLSKKPAFDSDWNLPKPEHIPRSTAWPAGLALGITLFFWGIIASLVVLAMGLAVFIVCLYGWIGEMRHETKQA
jgi:hypothetical protein